MCVSQARQEADDLRTQLASTQSELVTVSTQRDALQTELDRLRSELVQKVSNTHTHTHTHTRRDALQTENRGRQAKGVSWCRRWVAPKYSDTQTQTHNAHAHTHTHARARARESRVGSREIACKAT